MKYKIFKLNTIVCKNADIFAEKNERKNISTLGFCILEDLTFP